MSYGLLAVAAAMFGLYNVFIKVSADHIQAVLGALVLQVVAALVGLGWLLYLHATASAALQVSARGLALPGGDHRRGHRPAARGRQPLAFSAIVLIGAGIALFAWDPAR